jgi:aromatic-L-amino-acid decarboxylase
MRSSNDNSPFRDPVDVHESLDPNDWPALRAQGHRMLDDMFDYIQDIRQRPVWQPAPATAHEAFRQPLPRHGIGLAELHDTFLRDIVPYSVGNAHPGFMGWVHGGGTAVGMLAEMLAAGLNANVGGRSQMPVEVERQVTRWMAKLFGFPATASGLFVTGTSMANLIGVLIARVSALGTGVRSGGVAAGGARLVAYTSSAAHGCIAQAMDLAGLGTQRLRVIGVNDNFEFDIAELERAIESDRRDGLQPFFVAATVGTVDVGAIDDLQAVADIAQRHGLWFHVDGAYGALAMFSPTLAPRLAGIERADSLAFDFHKWGQVPYDAGFVLVRDAALQLQTFASPASYLRREARGLAAGSPWPCDLGPDLSRSFRALKVWFTLKAFGIDRIGKVIERTCELAQYLARRIEAHSELELLVPVALNIVCFRYRCAQPDRVNADIVASLHESGVAAPSTTTVHGQLAIRAAIVNHRTSQQDVDQLLSAVLALGTDRVDKAA